MAKAGKGRAGRGGGAGAAAPAARRGGAAARAVPSAQNKRTSDARRGGAGAGRGGMAAPQAAGRQAAGRQAHAPAAVVAPQPAAGRRQAVAANTAALAAQPKRVLIPRVPVDGSGSSLPWKVVLTRLVGEFADEATARALFSSESRGLAAGERLTIIKDGRT